MAKYIHRCVPHPFFFISSKENAENDDFRKLARARAQSELTALRECHASQLLKRIDLFTTCWAFTFSNVFNQNICLNGVYERKFIFLHPKHSSKLNGAHFLTIRA